MLLNEHKNLDKYYFEIFIFLNKKLINDLFLKLNDTQSNNYISDNLILIFLFKLKKLFYLYMYNYTEQVTLFLL